jgi:hypothetical protein
MIRSLLLTFGGVSIGIGLAPAIFPSLLLAQTFRCPDSPRLLASTHDREVVTCIYQARPEGMALKSRKFRRKTGQEVVDR